MTKCSVLGALLLGLVSVARPGPSLLVELRPLKAELVLGEPILLLLFLRNESSAASPVPGGVVRGLWEYRSPGGTWEPCHRTSWDSQVPSEVAIEARRDMGPDESRNLGLVSPICIEAKGKSTYEVRLRATSSCCGTTHPSLIKLVSGTSADARARSAPSDWGDFPDSVLAGYDYLSWRELDRLYDDPVAALEFGEYRTLRADEVGPTIDRMRTFLRNFPSFPFAQTIRLRLATELAIAGQSSEAKAELREISGTPQEPHVRQDAQRLEAALRARASNRDGGSAGKGHR